MIDDHCTTEWAARFADPWADFEHAGLEQVEAEPGQEVYKITDDSACRWKRSAEPLKQKWAADVKKAGGDPGAIMERAAGFAHAVQRRSLNAGVRAKHFIEVSVTPGSRS